MVCPRCVMAVENILTGEKIPFLSVRIGEAQLQGPLTAAQQSILDQRLTAIGFERIDDLKSRTISQIKTTISHYIAALSRQAVNINLSGYLTQQLHKDYGTLSRLFSEVEGVTIEHYAIGQKIEKVKELLVYDQLTLSQIAAQLDYSSVAHLSAQFKKQTGLTPSFYKKKRG